VCVIMTLFNEVITIMTLYKLTINISFDTWSPHFLSKWATLTLVEQARFILEVRNKQLLRRYYTLISNLANLDSYKKWCDEDPEVCLMLLASPSTTNLQLCQYYLETDNKVISEHISSKYPIVNKFFDLADHLDDFPSEFYRLVKVYHSPEVRLAYCLHHNILAAALKLDGDNMIAKLDTYPVQKQVEIIERAVTLALELPEDLEPHLAFVANLNYVAHDYVPKYNTFTVWSYLPSTAMTTSVVSYIASLPLPEDGYPRNILLVQGYYINRVHPNLNIFSIEDESYLDYSYLSSKYPAQLIEEIAKQRLLNGTDTVSLSLVKMVIVPLTLRAPFYLPYLILYYILTTRLTSLLSCTSADISTIVTLPDYQLRPIADIVNAQIVQRLKFITVVKQRLASLGLVEYQHH